MLGQISHLLPWSAHEMSTSAIGLSPSGLDHHLLIWAKPELLQDDFAGNTVRLYSCWTATGFYGSNLICISGLHFDPVTFRGSFG